MTQPSWAESEIIEELRFPSGQLMLEGRLYYPEHNTIRGRVVLVGPHPMLGGDLNNNVVRGVSTWLARCGVATLCFNYRGVGGSEGKPPAVTANLAEFWATSRIADESAYADDARAAKVELVELLRNVPYLSLVGYSFGCSLLPLIPCDPACPLILIAPTVGRHDYAAYKHVLNPILVIAPEQDFAVDSAQLEAWFENLSAPKQLIRGEWDDHFFRGWEEELAETIFSFLHAQWEAPSCR